VRSFLAAGHTSVDQREPLRTFPTLAHWVSDEHFCMEEILLFVGGVIAAVLGFLLLSKVACFLWLKRPKEKRDLVKGKP